MAKKNKEKKATGKAPAKGARKAKPAAAQKKPAAKAPAKAPAKSPPKSPAKPAAVPKPAPAPLPPKPPPASPFRAPGRPTLGVAAPRPGMGGPKFALPPARVGPPPSTDPLALRPRPITKMSARQPIGADELKAKIGALATAIAQIRALKRSVGRSFWEVGTILGDIRDRRLFEAKGYGSFDAFVEREIELGKTVSLRIARATQVLVKQAAVSAGMERSMAAVAALDGEADPSIPSGTTTSTGLQRSPIPVHKL